MAINLFVLQVLKIKLIAKLLILMVLLALLPWNLFTRMFGVHLMILVLMVQNIMFFFYHYTKYIWLYPMTHKSNVQTIFPQFRNLVENKFNTKIKSLYSDNGGEYIGLKSYLSIHGISHYTTAPHIPQQNGMSERRHCHLVG